MELSGSQFLQSLGWATLNSFWQAGLLWCLYLLATHLFQLSSQKKYSLAVTALVSSFAWFLLSFILFFISGKAENFAVVKLTIKDNYSILNIILSAASVAYLLLLSIPTYKLLQNWQHVYRLKKQGLQKSSFNCRLFVQKIGKHLGIQKKVHLYLSELVQSPLTIGFFKPVILLPVAAMNNLTPQQVEAILLHELAHIRRYDYLINILVAVIHTLLYFNPFVKRFLKTIEAERENCCDEMVLQFEYDKLSYASALLALEKQAAQHQLLAMAVTGKNTLLHRIERIVGMQKKPTFNITHFVGVAASLILIFVINSFIISGKEKISLRLDGFSAPFAFFSSDSYNLPATQDKIINNNKATQFVASVSTKSTRKNTVALVPIKIYTPYLSNETSNAPDEHLVQVGYDEVDGSLTNEQKEKVKSTVEATKKALKSEWHEVERTIPDGLSEQEKQMAQQEYYAQLDKMNWKNVEQNLKTQINSIDLDKINENLNAVILKAKIDSIQAAYSKILVELDKMQVAAAKAKSVAIPDVSKAQVQKAKVELQNKIQLLEAIKLKRVVKI
ncbi:MAG: hypothetical protein C4330_07410 [Chitinophagaceae bacterium]